MIDLIQYKKFLPHYSEPYSKTMIWISLLKVCFLGDIKGIKPILNTNFAYSKNYNITNSYFHDAPISDHHCKEFISANFYHNFSLSPNVFFFTTAMSGTKLIANLIILFKIKLISVESIKALSKNLLLKQISSLGYSETIFLQSWDTEFWKP